ncbi:MAG TPA: hypothetical protein PKC14_02890 [Candidatus Absconditabacterales bacterium]|nr:hypothetical protein [Candidatus Absconditabacterales bacterium]
MNQSKKLVMSLAVISAIATMGAATFAFNPAEKGMEKGPVKAFMQQNPELSAIMEKGDYEAFKKFISEKASEKKIPTKEEFEKMVALHKAMKNKDQETVKKLMEEMKTLREAKKAELDAVIEKGDFATFQKLVVNTPLAEKINTSEKFQKFVEMHKARQTAEKLAEELGLEKQSDNHGLRGEKKGMRMMKKEFEKTASKTAANTGSTIQK